MSVYGSDIDNLSDEITAALKRAAITISAAIISADPDIEVTTQQAVEAARALWVEAGHE